MVTQFHESLPPVGCFHGSSDAVRYLFYTEPSTVNSFLRKDREFYAPQSCPAGLSQIRFASLEPIASRNELADQEHRVRFSA